MKRKLCVSVKPGLRTICTIVHPRWICGNSRIYLWTQGSSGSQGWRRGLLCKTNPTLQYKRLTDLEDGVHEALWLTMRPPKLPRMVSMLAIGCIYHPPDANNSSMYHYLISCIDSILRRSPQAGMIISGDFNQLKDKFLSDHAIWLQTDCTGINSWWGDPG